MSDFFSRTLSNSQYAQTETLVSLLSKITVSIKHAEVKRRLENR